MAFVSIYHFVGQTPLMFYANIHCTVTLT